MTAMKICELVLILDNIASRYPTAYVDIDNSGDGGVHTVEVTPTTISLLCHERWPNGLPADASAIEAWRARPDGKIEVAKRPSPPPDGQWQHAEM